MSTNPQPIPINYYSKTETDLKLENLEQRIELRFDKLEHKIDLVEHKIDSIEQKLNFVVYINGGMLTLIGGAAITVCLKYFHVL